MSKTFLMKRFFSVASGAFAVLWLVYLAKGRPMNQALSEAFVWAIVSSALFTAVSYYRVQQCNHSCEVCRDTVEMP